jgi:bifunctional ADP-heptose synthase (sugar kinase/adenylyltransferase)
MDTREKIIDTTQAGRLIADGAIVVSGYFDPLIASHAERLAQLKPVGAKLLVLIASPENAILPAAARAELVAGLRAVDYVSELAEGLTPQIRLCCSTYTPGKRPRLKGTCAFWLCVSARWAM